MKPRLCIVCNREPAALPDRERMGRPIKRVCRACHAARLAGDIGRVLAMRRRVIEVTPEPDAQETQ